MLEQVFLILLTVATSVVAYAVSRRWLGLTRGRLGASVRAVLQLVGMSTIFLALNLAVGLVGILLVRGATGRFLSVYLLHDVTLCGLSLLQGVFFECWRAGGRPPGA